MENREKEGGGSCSLVAGGEEEDEGDEGGEGGEEPGHREGLRT